MNRASLIIVDAVLLASCKFERQQLAANVVVPGRRRLPTFRVECRNDTAQPVERVNVIDMARLDGTVLAGHAVRDSLGGPPPPGGVSTWIELIALAPLETRGFDIGIPTLHVLLQPGRHAVAFRCAGVWSEDAVFYWEPPP